MFGIPGEYLMSFVILGMGSVAFYAGSRSQEEWNEMVHYEYDRSPIRRQITKVAGLVLIGLGVCMFVGLLIVGPEFLAFLSE